MEKLFLTVVHMGINAGYLILAVAAARLLLKNAPKRLFCIMWIVVGLRLLCPFHIESAFSLLPEQTDSSAWNRSSAEMSENTLWEPSQLPVSGLLQAGAKNTAAKEADAKKSPPAAKADAKDTDQISKAVTAAAWLWLAGAAGMAAYLAFSWLKIRKQVCEAVPAMAENIRFYQCSSISTPFLFGLASPKIYVPFSVSDQELSYILKHEQAHKSYYDHLAKAAGYLLLSVYWFQPLVWAAYLLFCRDMELACDERVVQELGADCKKAYAQALLSWSLNNKTAGIYPVAFGEIGVKKRVKNILNYKKPSWRTVFAAALVCLIVTFCFATEAKSRHTPQTAPNADNAKTEYAQNTPSSAQTNLDAVTKHVTKWAEAFCGRNAQTISKMLDDNGRKQMDMLDGEHSFGWSSPWPWGAETIDSQPNYRILSVDECSAEILYYAWTSDPHVTVWRQMIAYKYSDKKGRLLIHETQLEFFDSIHTAKQFFAAYPDGEINGTRMDYYHGNDTGKALNANAKLYGNTLFSPDTAAVFLLNIQDDPSAVKTDVSQQNGETAVTFTFLTDGSTAIIQMIQPFGKEGIWVPQTLSRTAMAS